MFGSVLLVIVEVEPVVARVTRVHRPLRLAVSIVISGGSAGSRKRYKLFVDLNLQSYDKTDLSVI